MYENFPYIQIYKPKSKGNGVDIDWAQLLSFLIARGYRVYRLSKKVHELVRVVDNVVSIITPMDIGSDIMSYLHHTEPGNASIHGVFLKDIPKIKNDKFLTALPEINIMMKKDSHDSITIYYKNCIVEIRKGLPHKVYNYKDLKGHIWDSQILNRNYNETSNIECDFNMFITNISNSDDERYYSVCSTIGFLMHSYKNPGYCPAVILNDETISAHPEGGTGKGLLMKAISEFVKTVTIEGKTFSFDKNFVYQRVEADTGIMSFQDVNKNFDFERLFSVLTDGIEVEKKGRDSFFIPFENSPKVVITTNYAIPGTGNSHERRRHELEISQYYNKDRTPEIEFGRRFFEQWDKEEWSRFDAFMIGCAQYYLDNGIVKQKLKNLPQKRLMAATSPDFIEFMEDFDYISLKKSDMFDRFIGEYPEYMKKQWFTKQKLTQWLELYCSYFGIKVKEHRTNMGRFYAFEGEKVTKFEQIEANF